MEINIEQLHRNKHAAQDKGDTQGNNEACPAAKAEKVYCQDDNNCQQ